jgi:protein phosphatase
MSESHTTTLLLAPTRTVVPNSCPRRIDAFGLTHPGRQRRTNEDSLAVLPQFGLFLVADGMGGAAAGEVASRMAVDAVRAVFQDPELTWPYGLPHPPPTMGLPRLKAAVEYANARVHAASVADEAHAGMGTTLAALLVLGDRVALAHVGDSRVYGLRGRRFERLTADHTVVAALLQAGAITREDAETSEVRHVLARSIGTDATVDVDVRLVAVHPGDTFLLASDGLHGVVNDETIAAILLRERDLTIAVARLIERANELGGPDNITAVLVRVGDAT